MKNDVCYYSIEKQRVFDTAFKHTYGGLCNINAPNLLTIFF